MPVISFASPKGGAGKTTSAIVLATTLAQGVTVHIIDADPAARAFGWSEKGPIPKNLSISKSDGERKIRSEIVAARQAADFVIVDLEGAATLLSSRAFQESDVVVIPMGDEQQDAEAAIDALEQVTLAGEDAGRTISSAILFARTKAAVKARNERDINTSMRGNVATFRTELNSRTAFSSLHSYGGSLYDLDRSAVSGVDKAIENAESLAAEIIEKLEERA